jgi:hypothetical protein
MVLSMLAMTAPPSPEAATVRLDLVSRELLGAPYRLGPLGEEAPPDLDPRLRLDVFDCTTYVETVMALALAGADSSPEAKLALLDRIRYTAAEPTYEKRRHLIDAQWIPELVESGLLVDVTREIGRGAARRATVELRRRSWEESRLSRQLALDWSAIPAGRHSLPYLPWSALDDARVRGALPAAAILNLIVALEPDTPTLVIHQALLLRGAGGALVVRHASSLYRAVVEEPLDDFMAHAQARQRYRTLGLNVLAIRPGAWLRGDQG